MKNLFLLSLFSVLLALSDFDNIYDMKSSPRNIALGDLHISSYNINSVFDAPTKINKNDMFFSFNNQNNLLNVYHFGYSLYADENKNLVFGIVRREIKNNYNTSSAWFADSYPDLSEIDYNQIYKFNDIETGFLLSYNKIINNSLLGINLKPSYHSIDNISGIGFQMDIRYLFHINNSIISFGINNLLSTKKWDTHRIEKNNVDGYLNSSHIINNNIQLFVEYDMKYKSKLGIEFKISDNFFMRSGINLNFFSIGFGYHAKNIIIDYTYVDNNPIILGKNHIICFTLHKKN